MGRARPPQRPHVKRPSPLQQVHHTRARSNGEAALEPCSPPPVSLVKDPQFWKRFSVAVHQAEDDGKGDEESGTKRGSRSSVGTSNHWLAQQHKEKRHCRILCASITGLVLLVIIAAAVIGYYFTKIRKI